MASRPMVTQGFLLQRETVLGTAETDAMKRYLGLGARFGWDIRKEQFQAAGFKVQTGENTLTEMGSAEVSATQDYNAMLPLLAGIFGEPATTEAEATIAYDHAFSLDPKAPDTIAAFTAIFGDATQALLSTGFIFHGLRLTVGRTALNVTANALLSAPQTGATYPAAGVTDVPMVPVRAQTYDGFIDDSWAGLGTTKALALYKAEFDFGDKYTPDWVINSAVPSYASLVENENVKNSVNLTVGFDAAAKDLIDDALAGGLKFVRVATQGGLIGASTTEHYALQLDAAVSFTPGRIVSAPDAPVVAVEMNGTMQYDPVSTNVAAALLTNGLADL